MRQMHDELIGMFEGDNAQPLYNLEIAETESENEDGYDTRKADEDWTAAEE